MNCYSYWEYIPWVNLAVCRDSVDPKRYYIYRQWDSWKYHYTRDESLRKNHWCVSVKKWGSNYREYENYINFYEQVAQLPAFERNNSPIIEIQESKQKQLYFLQLLPTRSQQTTWNLERAPEFWEIEASFVRWSTPPEWIEVQVWEIGKFPNWDTGFSVSTNQLHFLAREKQLARNIEERSIDAELGIIVYPRNWWWCYEERSFLCGSEKLEWVVWDHGGRSIMHKPQVSVLMDESSYRQLWIEYWKPVHAHVISDGKKCYIKKLS